MVYLPGNLIPQADSDFEVALTGGWFNLQNATLSRDTTTAFTGSASLKVTATGATAQVAYQPIPVNPTKGYVYSLYAKSPIPGVGCQILVNCFNGGTYLTTLVSGFVNIGNNIWECVTYAPDLPVNTTSVTVFVQGVNTVAGNTYNIDLVYYAQSQTQVLVDWQNSPIGTSATAGTNWSDITPFVRADQTLTMNRGRQDNISTVQPGRASFTADNSTGWLTPGNTASPWSPGVVLGRRIQINRADETGLFRTRFDGQINEIDVIPIVTGQGTTVQIVCGDVLAFINRYPAFSSWTVEECQALNPTLQYLLNEPNGAPNAYDTSGNNGPALSPYTYPNAPYFVINTGGTNAYLNNPTIAYQSGSNPVEGAVPPTTAGGGSAQATSPISGPLPSMQFGAALNTSGKTTVALGGPSAQFQGQLFSPVTVQGGTGFTLLGWVWPNLTLQFSSLINYVQEMICLGNTRSGAMLGLEFGNNAATYTYKASYYTNYLKAAGSGTSTSGFSTPTFDFNGPVMVAVVVNGTTATFYLGGNLFNVGAGLHTAGTTVTIPSGTAFNYLSIGGPLGGGDGFLGNISNVCFYNTALSSAALTQLQYVGAEGPYGITSGVQTNHLCSYMGIPPYWLGTFDNGIATLDYQDLTGASASTIMQSMQAVEHGLYYVDATGKFNWHDRARRQGAGAPGTTLPAGSYNQDIAPKINDQYLTNLASYQNNRGGQGVVAQNNASIGKYGTYPNGSVQSPQANPYATWDYQYAQRQVSNFTAFQALNVYDNGNVGDAASWDVNTHGEPSMKLANLTIDMFRGMVGQSEYVAPSALYALEIDQNVTVGQNLPWWPNGPENAELFIEGVSESYSKDEGTITFYTSPAIQGHAWIPGNATYGQLDVSARVGITRNDVRSVPTWPLSVPTYAANMNQGAGANGFIGAADQRGVSSNLGMVTAPPLVYVQQTVNAQSLANSTATFMAWDATVLDTVQAANQYTSGGTALVCMFAGWYEFNVTVQFAANGTGDREIYIIQNQTGAQRNLAPAMKKGTSTSDTAIHTSCLVYCQIGDAYAVTAWQNSGGALGTILTNGGSHFSMRFLGTGGSRN